MIPEIEIWRAASLMLKRYGEKALEQHRAADRERRDAAGMPSSHADAIA